MRRFASALVALCLGASAVRADAPGDFDFYVLALSWSPSFCAEEGGNENAQQCASGRPYAFIVHGLWPQRERGFPQDCAVAERDVPRERMRGLLDLMPSFGLIRHQWRKHGSCSGLSQEDYFATLRRARETVVIPTEFRRPDAYRTVAPREVENRFRQFNPGLAADGIAVDCGRRLLREVRICLSKDLQFRACPEVDRRSCRLGAAGMPPAKGGR